MTVLVDLARRALACTPDSGNGAALWIGRKCWPSPHTLDPRDAGERDDAPPRAGLLARSVFVDTETTADRVWAAELASRSGAASVVVTDATGFRMADTRRLQLAAESCKAIVLLARPNTERGELTAARSRWDIEPFTDSESGLGFDQQWSVTLLCCKGVQPTVGSARRWVVRREHATGIVHDWQACGRDLAAPVADRCAATA